MLLHLNASAASAEPGRARTAASLDCRRTALPTDQSTGAHKPVCGQRPQPHHCRRTVVSGIVGRPGASSRPRGRRLVAALRQRSGAGAQQVYALEGRPSGSRLAVDPPCRACSPPERQTSKPCSRSCRRQHVCSRAAAFSKRLHRSSRQAPHGSSDCLHHRRPPPPPLRWRARAMTRRRPSRCLCEH